jgi:hypothetical protein
VTLWRSDLRRFEMMRLAPRWTFLLIISFGLSSTSCSTRYVGHKNEPRPFKSEDLDAKVKLTRQDALSIDRTTIGYLLSKTSPVVNYYHGVDTYKRSSWVGLGIMIGSAVAGWYGIDAWRNASETIPPYGDPNPDYERDKQLGQSITLCAIGGVITGAAIHFLANREVTESTIRPDTVITSTPLNHSQIKIYQADQPISIQRTDETGNFNVNLSPFFQDPFRGKDINLKILAPEYPSVMEQLSVPASFMTKLEQAENWRNAGFSSYAMQDWIDAGFLTPQAAMPWKQAELTPGEAQNWKERGLSATQARERLEAQRKAEAAARAKEEARKKQRENLKAQAKDLKTLILANPYDVSNKIYEAVGFRFQILSKSVALYRATDTFFFLADFGSSSAPYAFQGFVRAVGPYEYETVSGAKNTVPRLNVLFWDELE